MVKIRNKGFSSIQEEIFNFTQCSKVKSKYKEEFSRTAGGNMSEILDSEGICPDIDDDFLEKIELYGNYETANFSLLSVEVYPCENITSTSCEPISFTDTFQIFFSSIYTVFSPYEETNPFQRKVDFS